MTTFSHALARVVNFQAIYVDNLYSVMWGTYDHLISHVGELDFDIMIK